jgi:hypothetical protein
VSQQASVLTHAASGMPTGINVTADGVEVRKLLKKKKKRKKGETGPIYERTWFLVLCLAAVVGVVTWAVWPKSEETLWAKAKELMDSNDPLDWSRANDNYLLELQKRFPDGKSAAFVTESIDKIEMRKAEDRLTNRMRLGREPANEGERLYAQARRYELFGDRVTALEMYDSMIQVLPNEGDTRPFVNLARRQKAQIEASAEGKSDRLTIVKAALEKADQQYAAGDTVEANKIWNSIVSLYEKNSEMRPLVKRARDKLANKKGPASKAEPEDESEAN